MLARRIIESDDDEIEQQEIYVEEIEEEQVIFPKDYDEKDSSEEDVEEVKEPIKKPTKQDRIDTHMIAQRALREIQFELPQRKSKMNIHSFLEQRGIKRHDALEQLHASLRPVEKSDQGRDVVSDDNENEEMGIEQSDQKPEILVEETRSIKRDHLIPLETPHSSDSDAVDIIIVSKTPKKPKWIGMDNSITNSIKERKKSMLQLAEKQKEQRRLDEMEASRLEMEEMKKRRLERKMEKKLQLEARLALEAENKRLEETNQIEEQLEEDTVVVDKVADVIIDKSIEKQEDDEHTIHLEYSADKEEDSLDLESGSDIDDIPVAPIDTPIKNDNETCLDGVSAKLESVLNDEMDTMSSHNQSSEPPLHISDSNQNISTQSVLSLLSGSFSESQVFQEQPTIPRSIPKPNIVSQSISQLLSGTFGESKISTNQEETKKIEQSSTVLDLLSGNFPETQTQILLNQEAAEDVEMPNPVKMDDDDSIEEYEKQLTALPKDILEEQVKSDIDSESRSHMGTEDGQEDVFSGDDASQKEPISIQDMIYQDTDSDDEDVAEQEDISNEQEEDNEPASIEAVEDPKPKMVVTWSKVENANKLIQKSNPKFIEAEAEVEEDEFMNYGGAEGEDMNAKDEYDKTMLADSDEDVGDEKVIMELHQ